MVMVIVIVVIKILRGANTKSHINFIFINYYWV